MESDFPSPSEFNNSRCPHTKSIFIVEILLSCTRSNGTIAH
jgi:hypothetical protein